MFPGANNSMDNKGVIKIFRRNFFGSLCRKLSQGNPSVLCFRKLPIAKILWIRGGYQDFPSGKLCLRVPKTSVGEHFRAVFENSSGSEKLHG